MTDSISFDDSELRTLAADLAVAGATIAAGARAVVSKGATNVKKQLHREMASSKSFGVLADSITFDLVVEDDAIEAQIGPVKTRGGRRKTHKGANIAYFGTSRGGGTVPDPQGALDAETPKFEDALGDAVEKAI